MYHWKVFQVFFWLTTIYSVSQVRYTPLPSSSCFLSFFCHFCAYPAAYLPGIPLGCPTAHAAMPPIALSPPPRYPVFAPLKPLEKQLPAVQTFALNSSDGGAGGREGVKGGNQPNELFQTLFGCLTFFFLFSGPDTHNLPRLICQAKPPRTSCIPCPANAACIALSRVKNSISLLAHAKKKK